MENCVEQFEIFQQNLKYQLRELKNAIIEELDNETKKSGSLEDTLENVTRFLEEFESKVRDSDTYINLVKTVMQDQCKMLAQNRTAEQGDVATQTESCLCSDRNDNVDNVDNEDNEEWFDAEDVCSDINRSSDEVRDENPRILDVSCLGEEVTKIVPVSDEEAFLLAEKNIFLLSNNKLKLVVDGETVDDFVVFHDKSFLMLKQNSSYIMKRLANGRIVKFASMEPSLPLRIGINNHGNIIVLLKEKYTERKYDRNFKAYSEILTKYSVAIVNNVGILQSLNRYSCIYDNVIGIVSGFINADVIYQWYQNYISKTCFLKQYETELYRGSIGVDPSKTFKCSGFAITKDDDVIVADINHHSIHLLDKDLKFKKCLLNATDDLHAPGPIALYENHLWVIDSNNIKIFEWKEGKE